MLSIKEIKLGDVVSRNKTITDSDVVGFSVITGDDNPVHLDEDYASKSLFGAKIAHGMLTASFFSAIFGNEYPGPGCLYLSQNIKFLKPVFVGSQVTAVVSVKDVNVEKGVVTFLTESFIGDNKVVTGEAIILIPR